MTKIRDEVKRKGSSFRIRFLSPPIG